MGTENFHKKRKTRNTSRKRFERKSFLISLEDTKSSKLYFEELSRHKKINGKVVFAKHQGTDPGNVVKAILEHKKKYPNNNYEKCWAVFDKDDYSEKQIKAAIKLARSNSICIAISNEAYELWILLHFEQLKEKTSRKDLNSKLNRYFRKKFEEKYSKASPNVYKYIVGYQQQAIKNAKYLIAKHKRANGKIDVTTDNPITFIYQLVECLNSLPEKLSDDKEKAELKRGHQPTFTKTRRSESPG